jgi:hypothetical protein
MDPQVVVRMHALKNLWATPLGFWEREWIYSFQVRTKVSKNVKVVCQFSVLIFVEDAKFVHSRWDFWFCDARVKCTTEKRSRFRPLLQNGFGIPPTFQTPAAKL